MTNVIKERILLTLVIVMEYYLQDVLLSILGVATFLIIDKFFS